MNFIQRFCLCCYIIIKLLRVEESITNLGMISQVSDYIKPQLIHTSWTSKIVQVLHFYNFYVPLFTVKTKRCIVNFMNSRTSITSDNYCTMFSISMGCRFNSIVFENGRPCGHWNRNFPPRWLPSKMSEQTESVSENSAIN